MLKDKSEDIIHLLFCTFLFHMLHFMTKVLVKQMLSACILLWTHDILLLLFIIDLLGKLFLVLGVKMSWIDVQPYSKCFTFSFDIWVNKLIENISVTGWKFSNLKHLRTMYQPWPWETVKHSDVNKKKLIMRYFFPEGIDDWSYKLGSAAGCVFTLFLI